MRLLLKVFLPLIIVATTAAAESSVVFSATPTSYTSSSANEAKNSKLNQTQKSEAKILITKVDGKYYWSTRENRELIHTSGGAFDTFVDPKGGGYIKILDQNKLPDLMRTSGPRYQYIESISLMLSTLTYWGSTNEFNL